MTSTTHVPVRLSLRAHRWAAVPVALCLGLAAVSLTPTRSAAATSPGPGKAHVATVLVFNDPDFVDTIALEEVNENEEGYEAANVQLVLAEAGNRVATLDDASTDLAGALAGMDAFVIPELERNNAYIAEMTTEDRQALLAWTEAGGTLVSMARTHDLLPEVFDLADPSYPNLYGSPWSYVAGPRSPFAGSSKTLRDFSATDAWSTAELPAGSTVLFASTDPDSDATPAWTLPVGAGDLVMLGWDWYDAKSSAVPEGKNAGWNPVLNTAVTIGIPALGRVGSLKTATTGSRVKVNWKAPAKATVRGYDLAVFKKSRTKAVLTRTRPASKRAVTIRTGSLTKGTYVVKVRAENSTGVGPAATRSFRVR